MKLIDKAALVAEIEECISTYKRVLNKIDKSSDELVTSTSMLESKIDALQHILSFINTLEVEVDLEKEVDDWYNTKASKEFENVLYSDIENCAKHFFAIGLKTSNPLTWEDMMTIHKCIKDAMNLHLYEWSTIDGQQKIYEDVLKRFKETRNERPV